MKKKMFRYPGLLFILLLFWGCSEKNHQETGEDFLNAHVTWLADEARNGRLAGTIYEADAANYISDQFLQFGLEPAGDDGSYIQQFVLEGPMVQAMGLENHISRNVAGKTEGTGFPDRYIIIGAHFDGQGTGGAISMNTTTEPLLHYSADDNASGTTGLFYLAEKFTEKPLRSSILFVAFSGEELGLLGSKHFADELDVPPDSILAMINLDMIGRLTGNELHIFGTGTSSVWDQVLSAVETDSLKITSSPGGMGSSDHTSFYKKEIPVLHYYTGTHNQYHRETDTADKINFTGMGRVLTHAEEVIRLVDSMNPSEIDFRESTDPRSVSRRSGSVGLGVMPDYAYPGPGLRIDRVQPDKVADRAGIQDGDVIMEMNGSVVSDIYDYMETLNTLEKGDTASVKINRNEEEVDLTVTF